VNRQRPPGQPGTGPPGNDKKLIFIGQLEYFGRLNSGFGKYDSIRNKHLPRGVIRITQAILLLPGAMRFSDNCLQLIKHLIH